MTIASHVIGRALLAQLHGTPGKTIYTQPLHRWNRWKKEVPKLKKKRPWRLCEHFDTELSHTQYFEHKTTISKLEFGKENPKGLDQMLYRTRCHPVKTIPAGVMHRRCLKMSEITWSERMKYLKKCTHHPRTWKTT